MRKILAVYFLALSVITIPVFIASGVFTTQGAIYGISTLPFIYLGAHLGNKIADKVPQRYYKFIALGTVIAAGLFAIHSGLR